MINALSSTTTMAINRPANTSPVSFSALSAVQKKHVIYGGTFNPVHRGHVQMVDAVIKHLNAERVIIMPAGDPPHKKDIKIVSFDERMEMVKAAFNHLKEAVFSQAERFKKPSDTYTLDTLQTVFKVDNLSKVGFKIPFVIGTDALKGLPTWGGAKELAENLLFIVFKRNGDQIPDKLTIDGSTVDLDVETIQANIAPLSSSEIRERLEQGVSAKTLVPDLPESVAQIIDDRDLY